MSEFDRLWDQIEHDLGFNDHNMVRGEAEIRGITFRDLRDAFIRAVLLSTGAEIHRRRRLAASLRGSV